MHTRALCRMKNALIYTTGVCRVKNYLDPDYVVPAAEKKQLLSTVYTSSSINQSNISSVLLHPPCRQVQPRVEGAGALAAAAVLVQPDHEHGGQVLGEAGRFSNMFCFFEISSYKGV